MAKLGCSWIRGYGYVSSASVPYICTNPPSPQWLLIPSAVSNHSQFESYLVPPPSFPTHDPLMTYFWSPFTACWGECGVTSVQAAAWNGCHKAGGQHRAGQNSGSFGSTAASDRPRILSQCSHFAWARMRGRGAGGGVNGMMQKWFARGSASAYLHPNACNGGRYQTQHSTSTANGQQENPDCTCVYKRVPCAAPHVSQRTPPLPPPLSQPL